MNEKIVTYHTLFLALLCALLTSCNMNDKRDECCGEGSVMTFRYLLGSVDEFAECISSMQYFLFDERGSFIFEMEPLNGDMTKVDLGGLSEGTYTMVAIGNLEDYGSLSDYAEEGLDGFYLTVDDVYDGSQSNSSGKILANGDLLYWGQSDFTIVEGQSKTYRTEMSNVHCKLTIMVEWEGVPAYSSGYTFSLDGIGSRLSLNAEQSDTIGVHTFPAVSGRTAAMMEDVTMRNLSLETSLYTLRLSEEEEMPVFQLYHGGEEQIPDVDLASVFSQWSWKPSVAAVQEYEMLILIMLDGSIKISDSLEFSSLDWSDGGTIG